MPHLQLDILVKRVRGVAVCPDAPDLNVQTITDIQRRLH